MTSTRIFRIYDAGSAVPPLPPPMVDNPSNLLFCTVPLRPPLWCGVVWLCPRCLALFPSAPPSNPPSLPPLCFGIWVCLKSGPPCFVVWFGAWACSHSLRPVIVILIVLTIIIIIIIIIMFLSWVNFLGQLPQEAGLAGTRSCSQLLFFFNTLTWKVSTVTRIGCL